MQEATDRTILIGPTHCEFGWLMMFVARARFRARQYGRVVVYCEEQVADLFRDFAVEIETYPAKKGWRDRWLFNGERMRVPQEIIDKYKPDKIYSPVNDHCIRNTPEFYRYGKPDAALKYDILIHARSRQGNDWIDKSVGGSRNYPINNYVKTIKELPDLRIASIGSIKDAEHVPFTDDCRGIPLVLLMDILASSRVCIGTSSFPMHFANACGCPTIVFTDDAHQKSVGGTNRQRYEKYWRMTDAPVTVIDKYGWKPPRLEVLKAIRKQLEIQ
jgi:hypothetical protein